MCNSEQFSIWVIQFHYSQWQKPWRQHLRPWRSVARQRPSSPTSLRYWSRFTQIPASPRRVLRSWTTSWLIPSTRSQAKHLSCAAWTRLPQLVAEKFNPRSAWFFQVNCPSMLFRKEQKQWRSSPKLKKCRASSKTRCPSTPPMSKVCKECRASWKNRCPSAHLLCLK